MFHQRLSIASSWQLFTTTCTRWCVHAGIRTAEATDAASEAVLSIIRYAAAPDVEDSRYSVTSPVRCGCCSCQADPSSDWLPIGAKSSFPSLVGPEAAFHLRQPLSFPRKQNNTNKVIIKARFYLHVMLSPRFNTIPMQQQD